MSLLSAVVSSGQNVGVPGTLQIDDQEIFISEASNPPLPLIQLNANFSPSAVALRSLVALIPTIPRPSQYPPEELEVVTPNWTLPQAAHAIKGVFSTQTELREQLSGSDFEIL